MSKTVIEQQYALYDYVNSFVTDMAASGVRHVCISPGSRSTPLAMVLADHPEIKLWLHIDERSAAFFALGLAKASHTPVALVCTSGTAAANYLPAVVEAHYSRVPLLVLTADRPHEVRECGAPQAIDQIRIYGSHVKWFVDMPLPEASTCAINHVRVVACRATGMTLTSPPGPVHVNFPFRDPLIPLPRPELVRELSATDADRPPYVTVSHDGRRLSADSIATLAADLQAARRGLILTGPQDDLGLAKPLVELAAVLHYPILADPLSQIRCGPEIADIHIAAYDALLRDKEFASQAPDLVLRIGAMPTAKTILQYLQQHGGCRHIVVDPGDGWNEPTGLATDILHADPVALCYDLLDAVTTSSMSAAPGSVEMPTSTANIELAQDWLLRWQKANQVAGQTMKQVVAEMPGVFEGRVFTELADLLPDGAALYVGNSMPVRDLDTFFPASPEQFAFFANRGANGIDGVVSSALGAAAVWPKPLVLVIGDLSFYHDLNGLLATKLHGIHAVIVLINNNGGGIFSFLPQAEHPSHFEALFSTPTNLDFRPAVEMYGGRFVSVTEWPEFHAAVTEGLASCGLTVVEVRTDRNANTKMHRQVWAKVSEALRKAGL